MTRKHIDIGVKVETRLEVSASWVRTCRTRNTIVSNIVGVKEIVCGVDSHLNVCTVSEDTVLRLERDAIIKLAHTDKTRDRVEQMLKTGKPLRN